MSSNEIAENEYTITISVGQLTTGVIIPELPAIIILSNIASPALYMQAAFRAQNPHQYEKNGKYYKKENAYIFDFAPDRTLVMFDEFANKLVGDTGGGEKDRQENIKRLLNFFPVIGEDENGAMALLNAEFAKDLNEALRETIEEQMTKQVEEQAQIKANKNKDAKEDETHALQSRMANSLNCWRRLSGIRIRDSARTARTRGARRSRVRESVIDFVCVAWEIVTSQIINNQFCLA